MDENQLKDVYLQTALRHTDFHLGLLYCVDGIFPFFFGRFGWRFVIDARILNTSRRLGSCELESANPLLAAVHPGV